MATLEQGLISYLTGYASLSSLISARVYCITKPQSVIYPCVTFQRISTPRIHTHDTSGASGDLATPRIQFDVWAATFASAKAITDVLRAALNGKKGSIGTAPYAVTIQASLVDTEDATFDINNEMFRSRSDYMIAHAE